MKKYVKIGRSLYEIVDLAGAVFVAALVAMLVSATWLSFDWITRNNVSTWAIVCLVAGTVISGTTTAIFSDFNERRK